MNDKLIINTNLNYKASGYMRDKCVVEKVIEIPETDFKRLLAAPLEDKYYIKQNCELMGVDDDSTSHCVLVIDCHNGDGMLIESEGYNYARYSQYIPNAREIVKAHEQVSALDSLKTHMDSCVDRWLEQHENESEIRVPLSDFINNKYLAEILADYASESFSKHPQIAGCSIENVFIEAKRHDLTETKLCCPLKFLYSLDDNSDLMEVDSANYVGYDDEINFRIKQSINSELELKERGLLAFSDNQKVYSAFPRVETKNGDIYGVVTVKSYGEMSKAELIDLVDELMGQLSDGWGEGFEQREITLGGDKVCISFWNPDDFYLKPESEVFPEQECGQTMGGLS